ncbi:MAG: hypothetical protein JO333_15005 [Verrucomicrobia bacterium]|nr:hypothetical protein [Verrucomicrobiota bacterium]
MLNKILGSSRRLDQLSVITNQFQVRRYTLISKPSTRAVLPGVLISDY